MNELMKALEMMEGMSQEEFNKIEKENNLDQKNYSTKSYLDDFLEIGLNLDEELCQEYKYPTGNLGDSYSIAA